MSGKDRTKFTRAARIAMIPFVLLNVGIVAAVAATAGTVAFLNVIAAVFLVLVMCFQTVIIRRIEYQNRPHPDYISIAAMEREIYGESFRHDGTPQDGRGPIASALLPKDRDPSVRLMCRLGHETRVRGTMPPRTCPVCDEQRRECRTPAAPGPARPGTSTAVYTAGGVVAPGGGAGGDSFWQHIEEARRLTEQIDAANRPDDDEWPS